MPWRQANRPSSQLCSPLPPSRLTPPVPSLPPSSLSPHTQERNYIARKEAERARRELFDDALSKFKKGKIEDVSERRKGPRAGLGAAGRARAQRFFAVPQSRTHLNCCCYCPARLNPQALIDFENVLGMEPKNYLGDDFSRVTQVYRVTQYNIGACGWGVDMVGVVVWVCGCGQGRADVARRAHCGCSAAIRTARAAHVPPRRLHHTTCHPCSLLLFHVGRRDRWA